MPKPYKNSADAAGWKGKDPNSILEGGPKASTSKSGKQNEGPHDPMPSKVKK